jgi:uncharacterized membrane protein
MRFSDRVLRKQRLMNGLISGAHRRIVGTFLAGLITVLPLVITIAVIVWVANLIQGFVGPNSYLGGWLQSAGMRLAPAGNTTLAYVIGCLLVLVSVFLLGMLVRTGLRNVVHGLVEAFMRRIPIAGSVYGAATQIVGLLEKKDESELKTMSVVYCTLGGVTGAGILTLLPTPDRYRINDREYHIVYIPTSPVPMTGGLLFVPVDSVRPVDMSIESLMSIYLSMGVTGPQFLQGDR